MGDKILNSPIVQQASKFISWMTMIILGFVSYEFNSSVNRISELEKQQRESELEKMKLETQFEDFQDFQKQQNHELKRDLENIDEKLDLLIQGR